VGPELQGLVDFARQTGVGSQPGADAAVMMHRLGPGVRSTCAGTSKERFSTRIEYFVPLSRQSDGRPVLLVVHGDANGGAPVDELVADIDQMALGIEMRSESGVAYEPNKGGEEA
jgi:hypothetical protein